jgi:hypothetical protein
VSKKDLTEDIFSKYVESILKNVHTCLPGKIESYDKSKRKAKVKVLIKYRTDLETELKIPPIDNVPVIFPSGANFTLEWSLKKNDGCLVLFSEEGIGNYLNGTNQEVSSDSYARFQLTDAICLPGLFSFKGIPSSKNTIEIDESGNINIDALQNVNINGDTRNLVSHTELNTALQILVAAINATFATKVNGAGSPGTLILDISASKVNTVKVGL